MIRKLAIAVDVNGVIGNAGKLLCNCPADMANFANFTRGTALIVGRKSAEEMFALGFSPSESRPLIVLTETGKLSPTGESVRHVYYVNNLVDAIDLAVDLYHEKGLLGYTVAGGKTVYDQYLLNTNGYGLDAVYITTFQKQMTNLASPNVVKLAGGHPGSQLSKMLRNPKSQYFNANVHGGIHGVGPTRIPTTFAYIYDTFRLDPAGISLLPNNVLRICGSSGIVTIPLNTIAGYQESRGAAHLEIYTAYHKFDIRMNSGYAGITYLKHIIDQHLITKGIK